MGKVEVTFYGALSQVTQEKRIRIDGSTLTEVMNALDARYGRPFINKVYDEKGKLRRFINIYVNGKDIRFLGNLGTKLTTGDNVSIVPAVGGG